MKWRRPYGYDDTHGVDATTPTAKEVDMTN
jgi:hypothetical protein